MRTSGVMKGCVGILTALILGVLGTSVLAKNPPEVKFGEWETLFEGRTHQFRGYKLYDFPKRSWKLERGELVALTNAPQIDLVSMKLYQDFELEVDWRVGAGGDGGILYRVMEDEGPTWYSGLEYQILDEQNPNPEDADEFKRTTGSLYDIAGTRANKQVLPVGQYNHTLIRVQGTKVEHWLNGQKILSFDVSTPQFRDLVKKSRFKNLPRFGREPEGHVCLQHMGTEIAFKRIRIKRLAPEATAVDGK